MQDIAVPEKRRKISRHKQPTQELLGCLFTYGEDGSLWWKCRPREDFRTERGWRVFQSQRSGMRAGNYSHNGYRKILVNGVQHYEHVLIWIWHNGEIPHGFDVDHRHGVEAGNKIQNLRLNTRSGNAKNARRSRANKSGVTGVSWNAARKKWVGWVAHHGKSYYCGIHQSIDMAERAVKEKRAEFGFSERHGQALPLDRLSRTLQA